MQASDFLILLLLGGLLGALGQGIRVVTGIKKANDQAELDGKTLKEVFEGGRLSLSLMIGFIAGALAAMALYGGGTALPAVGSEVWTSLLGAGYAGTDAIEAFMKKHLPGGGASIATGTPPEPRAFG